MASAGGYLSYENIADKATVAGVEVEIRKNLFVRPVSNAAHGMNKLSLGLNGSYIYTNAKMPLATVTTGSQLEGAAPWIVNFDLSHNFTKGERSFVNTLVLNYVSDNLISSPGLECTRHSQAYIYSFLIIIQYHLFPVFVRFAA